MRNELFSFSKFICLYKIVWVIHNWKSVFHPNKNVLTQIFGNILYNVKTIGIDFDHENIGDVLIKNGYSNDKKIFFIWECVTQYLAEESDRSMFDFLSHTQTGSKIAFTYVLKDFIEGKKCRIWTISTKMRY